MKYLKKFNSLNESEQNDLTTGIFKTIIQEFTKDKVAELLDDEIMNWVDSDWEDEHESEYDWYVDYGNGEAEDVVLDSLISWYQSKHGEISDPEVRYEVYNMLKDHYGYMF